MCILQSKRFRVQTHRNLNKHPTPFIKELQRCNHLYLKGCLYISEQIILKQVPSSASRNTYCHQKFRRYTLDYTLHDQHGKLALCPALQSCQIFKPRPVSKIRWKQKYYLFVRALQNVWVLPVENALTLLLLYPYQQSHQTLVSCRQITAP